MTSFQNAEKRYREDPHFKAIVEMLINSVDQLSFTPGDLRQMAVFAEYLWQMRNSKTVFYPSDLVDGPAIRAAKEGA